MLSLVLHTMGCQNVVAVLGVMGNADQCLCLCPARCAWLTCGVRGPQGPGTTWLQAPRGARLPQECTRSAVSAWQVLCAGLCVLRQGST